jgi:DNA-binding IscR family transcriptional regulator
MTMRTNGRFATAVHILTVLAYKNGDPVSSSLLSASVNTNPVIIRRLLLALQAARLIKTGKGARAGSRLRRSAESITLADVYRAMRCPGPFDLPKRRPNERCPVGRGIRCALRQVLGDAKEALERDLGRTNLALLLETIKAENNPGPASQPASGNARTGRSDKVERGEG